MNRLDSKIDLLATTLLVVAFGSLLLLSVGSLWQSYELRADRLDERAQVAECQRMVNSLIHQLIEVRDSLRVEIPNGR